MNDTWACPHCREKDRLLKELKDMLDIVTDLADHRWKALNEIYEQDVNEFYSCDGYAAWVERKAAEGLHLKK